MMVGADKARRLLTELVGSVSDLKRYRASVTREDLRTNRDTQHMVLHALYVATQSALDLAMHLGADAGLPQAETYQDAFRRLGEAGWLEPPLVERLAAWAGFRNVLAHLYATVDYDRAYDALTDVSDLERFAAVVSAKLGV
jgi:uncharacterized protein YutE (UPF0331/DUF86 family)